LIRYGFRCRDVSFDLYWLLVPVLYSPWKTWKFFFEKQNSLAVLRGLVRKCKNSRGACLNSLERTQGGLKGRGPLFEFARPILRGWGGGVAPLKIFFSKNFLKNFSKIFPKNFSKIFPKNFLKHFSEKFFENFSKIFQKIFSKNFLKMFPKIFPKFFFEFFPKNFPKIFQKIFPKIFPKNFQKIFHKIFLKILNYEIFKWS